MPDQPSDQPSDQPPDQPSPLTPDPLTPAQTRARRAQQMETIRQGQQARLLPRVAPPPLPVGRQPAKRLFALSDVQRVLVTQTAAAHAFLVSSSSEGRLFPQALAEMFAGVDGVVRIDLDYTPLATHLHPLALAAQPALADRQALVVTIIHSDRYTADRRALLNPDDVTALHGVTHHVTFRAVLMAQELVRLYPILPQLPIRHEVTPVVRPD